DPSIVVYPNAITPNLHALANNFVDLDNFYDSGEVSGDGWNWSTSARAADTIEKTEPINYAGRGLNYDYEGTNRNVNVGYATPDAFSTKGALQPITDPFFRGYDNHFPDFYRVEEWAREFDQFEQNGNLPNLELLRVMHDHTGSFSTAIDGVNTPEIQTADNDY